MCYFWILEFLCCYTLSEIDEYESVQTEEDDTNEHEKNEKESENHETEKLIKDEKECDENEDEWLASIYEEDYEFV